MSFKANSSMGKNGEKRIDKLVAIDLYCENV